MSVSVTIHPSSHDLHMYGPSDPASAYSLSGHISISLSSPFSLFESRRTARLLLQSISLTFEGQSEVFTPNTGYSSLRLCAVTRELAPSVPIELSNQGHEDSSEPCVWNIIFNLPIPGWLPETTCIGIEEIGIRYTLYATAKFTNVEEEQNTSWAISTLCAPFRSRVKTVEAHKPITLRRFISPPKPEVTETPILNYLVNSTPSYSREQLDNDRIPADVLSKVQVLASVPEFVDIKSDVLPLTLRLRTKDLSEEHCKRIQLTDVQVDILQQEKCRYKPSATYLARYPLPPKSQQPPNLPLRDPHPMSSVYDVGLYVSAEFSESVCRTFSLLPSKESGRYTLPDDNYVFINDASTDAPPTWYTMDTTVPFVQRNTRDPYEASEWAGPKDIRVSSHSPLYSVVHDVSISLTCTYDLEGGKVAKERLSFKIPLTFGQVAPKPTLAAIRCLGFLSATAPSAQADRVAAAALPAYSQLYDSNGDPKIDYSVPLPLYTPRSTPQSSPTPSIDISSHPSVPEPPTTIGNVNTYHDGLDGESEKRPTPLLVQDGGHFKCHLIATSIAATSFSRMLSASCPQFSNISLSLSFAIPTNLSPCTWTVHTHLHPTYRWPL